MNHRHSSTCLSKAPNASAITKSKIPRRKAVAMAATAVLRFRSVLAAAIARRRGMPPRHVVGTLYGRRRGHMHLAFQAEPQSHPVVLLQLPTPTNELAREMAASGLMRIALECDRQPKEMRLTEEPMWRVCCNGLRRGYAVRRKCGKDDRKILHSIGLVTAGAGVLPPANGVAGEEEGEVMYVRARFERVVGSKDSEAFYMMNLRGNDGADELSVYLLRV